MKIVEFNTSANRKVWINFAHVAGILEVNDSQTDLIFAVGDPIIIQEPIAEVVQKATQTGLPLPD
jgi:hypothetical protein